MRLLERDRQDAGTGSSNYVTIRPGNDVRPFPDQLKWDASLVAYEANGAYGGHISNATAKSRLAALMAFGKGLVIVLVKWAIKYQTIPFHVRKARGLGGRLAFARAGIHNLFSGDMRARTASGDADMDQNGCLVVTIPPDRLSELEAKLAPEFARLTTVRGPASQRNRSFEESRIEASRLEQAGLFSCIESILEDSGILAASSNYLGRQAKLIDLNPQINDVSDTFWRSIFPDLKDKPIPATAYCHRDSSGGDLKAIIYLTDVGERNGPFGYVVGSNRMLVSGMDNLICEVNDHNGLASTVLAARQAFAALPRKLRQKGAFGNDVIDGSEFGATILEGLWSITASKGSIILFDTKGIHRGGMVIEGERRVVTCVIG